MRVFVDKDLLAATLTASAFTLIGPDAGYAGVHAQAEICASKLCFRKMSSFVSNGNATGMLYYESAFLYQITLYLF